MHMRWRLISCSDAPWTTVLQLGRLAMVAQSMDRQCHNSREYVVASATIATLRTPFVYALALPTRVRECAVAVVCLYVRGRVSVCSHLCLLECAYANVYPCVCFGRAKHSPACIYRDCTCLLLDPLS